MIRFLFLIVMTALLSFQGGPAFASEERAETVEAVIESVVFSKQSKQCKVKRVAPQVTPPVFIPQTLTRVSFDQLFLPVRRHIFYRVLLI